jgi:PKD repeat protein
VPTDLDADGLYEDVNGNGAVDFDDVVGYWKNLEWIGAQTMAPLFDFNGNGEIDFNDVVILYQRV